jgi:hypothetical protein
MIKTFAGGMRECLICMIVGRSPTNQTLKIVKSVGDLEKKLKIPKCAYGFVRQTKHVTLRSRTWPASHASHDCKAITVRSAALMAIGYTSTKQRIQKKKLQTPFSLGSTLGWNRQVKKITITDAFFEFPVFMRVFVGVLSLFCRFFCRFFVAF